MGYSPVARIVLYDACVLYPAPLRDLLMRLAVVGPVPGPLDGPRSTTSGRERPGGSAGHHGREPRSMPGPDGRHVPDCLVTGYEPLISTLTLPDPDDRHVLAAAIHGGATSIVTFNCATSRRRS